MFFNFSSPACHAAGIFLAGLLLPFVATAQGLGSVSGNVVSSWNAAPLPGVTITVRGTTLAAQTDPAGHFALTNVPAGEQVLRFSKAGFAAATVTEVRILTDQTTTVNGNLRPEFFDLEEYVVTAEEFAEQTEKIMFDRQQSGAMVDAIGSEQFSKLGSSDAGAIVARVTGVSVVGGKYAVVRGLSDRYTRTLFNGVEVPSADPYKLSPQLDLFPAAMIDRISVSKTFTPDQPGGTGGGTIDIRTKKFPEKPFLKFSMGTGLSLRSNLKKNFLADPGSSMNPIALPSGPRPLSPGLFEILDPPNVPGPASPRNETLERAQERRAQANAVQELMQGMGTANFAGKKQGSPLNTSFTMAAGDTQKVLGHDLGFFGGLNYKREFRAVDRALVRRYNPDGSPQKLGVEQRGNISTDYGANVNLGYNLWENSDVGFNFMLAHSTDEESRHASFRFVEGRDDHLEQWQQHFTDREILNYQLNGQHEFPHFLDSKLEWVVSLANTAQNEPDQRFMNYFLSDSGQAGFGDAATPFPQYPSRYFREITEDGFNYRADWTVPLAFMPEDSKIKAGYFSSGNQRNFREQFFTYNGSAGFDPNHPNTYLNDPDYFDYVATWQPPRRGGDSQIQTNYAFARSVNESYAHPYKASLDVNAAYLMADAGLLSWLRVIGGARVENTRMNLKSKRDGSAKIKQTDLLPAGSLVVTIVTNLTLRVGYGETVSRPSYREIAPVQGYLPDLGLTAVGNPALKMIGIKSYDARLEWFPSPGDIFSVGVFMKEVTRAIELYSRSLSDDQVTWINRTNGAASLAGIEIEMRKSLEFMSHHLRGLTVGANATLIASSTKLTRDELSNKRGADPKAAATRPLYDQSPYIVNVDVTYEHPTSGTSLTVGANFTGERIVLAKTLGPDIYEHPPVSLDAAISQKLWHYWVLRLGVKNILDLDFRQTYGASYKGKIFQSYQRGLTYTLTLSGEF